MSDPRLMTPQQAADYLGLSMSSLRDWVAREIIPGPMDGTRRYDRRAIDAALDKRSKLKPVTLPPASEAESAYDSWKAGH